MSPEASPPAPGREDTWLRVHGLWLSKGRPRRKDGASRNKTRTGLLEMIPGKAKKRARVDVAS